MNISVNVSLLTSRYWRLDCLKVMFRRKRGGQDFTGYRQEWFCKGLICVCPLSGSAFALRYLTLSLSADSLKPTGSKHDPPRIRDYTEAKRESCPLQTGGEASAADPAAAIWSTEIQAFTVRVFLTLRLPVLFVSCSLMVSSTSVT